MTRDRNRVAMIGGYRRSIESIHTEAAAFLLRAGPGRRR
jgi:hypothetical protein